MSSGFTAEFEKREPSFEEFLWKCARGMGAFIHMREDSMDAPLRLPQENDFGTYHEDALNKAVRALQDYSTMSTEKAKMLLEKEYETTHKHAKEMINERNTLRKRYESMLAKVKAWQPPTKDHDNFKKFMVEQLEKSIEWDCDVKYYKEQLEAPRQSPKEWLADMVSQAKRDIEYHTKHLSTDKIRSQERADWIQALMKSVPIPEKMLRKS